MLKTKKKHDKLMEYLTTGLRIFVFSSLLENKNTESYKIIIVTP